MTHCVTVIISQQQVTAILLRFRAISALQPEIGTSRHKPLISRLMRRRDGLKTDVRAFRELFTLRLFVFGGSYQRILVRLKSRRLAGMPRSLNGGRSRRSGWNTGIARFSANRYAPTP